MKDMQENIIYQIDEFCFFFFLVFCQKIKYWTTPSVEKGKLNKKKIKKKTTELNRK